MKSFSAAIMNADEHDIRRVCKDLQRSATVRKPAEYEAYDGGFSASVRPEGCMTRLTMKSGSGFEISTKVQSDHVGNSAHQIITQAIKRQALPPDICQDVVLQNVFYPDSNPRYRLLNTKRDQLMKTMFLNRLRGNGMLTRSQALLKAQYNALQNDDMNRYLALTY